MGFFRFQLLCLIFAIIFIHFGQVTVAQPSYRYHFCQGGNYTNNSQFQRNLNLTLSFLSSNITASKKFYNSSNGQIPDRVYGILLCRIDITNEACNACADTATEEVTQRCPNSKEFISWYDECILRYSDKNIFSVMQVEPSVSLLKTGNVSNPDPFDRSVSQLMDSLVRRAASDVVPNTKFATGESNHSAFQNIYGLVQCAPDITGSDCNRCLTGAVNKLPSCCSGRPGGSVLRPSCNVRYETYPFFESTATAPPPGPPSPVTVPPPPNGNGGKSNRTVVIIAVVVSVPVLVLMSAIIICFCKRKRKPKENFDNVDEIDNVDFLQFDFVTIRAARITSQLLISLEKEDLVLFTRVGYRMDKI